ncbi:MAG: acyl-CoA mutase large subunit family protein [Clostridiales bacterium]|nr:acyl-CoA mutase large subunit family protein [Clostridiales bacterium]
MDKEKTPLPVVDFCEFTPPTYEEWKEEAIVSLKGAPFDKKLLTKTYEGITLQPLYTAEHAASFAAKDGLPGQEGYLRGATAAGYSAKPWLIAQYGDISCPQEANALLSEGLNKGATAICFNPNCCPKITTLDDIKAFFKGIDITGYPFQVFCGTSAAPALALLKAYTDEAGLDASCLTGVVGADPLGKLALKGENQGSIAGYYDQMATCLKWAAKNMPQLKTIFIQGSMYHEGGASAVDELAAMFAASIAYLDALTERGFTVDEIAEKMVFSFSLGANFFMEIAKLRAARLLWAQLIEAYGGSTTAAKLDARAATSHFTATLYDPYVNILRATTQAFCGVVGGVEALTVAPFDAAIRESDEHSRRVARNIQVMLQNEFNLTTPIDPAGGSWYIETLTGQLAETVWGKLQAIEKEGGLLAALKVGTVQNTIAETLKERFQKLAIRADKAVGSNMYPNMQETPLRRGELCSPVATLPANEPPIVAPSAVANIDGSICAIAGAFTAGATMAQIKTALNKGESEKVTPIIPHRWTEQFEALRSKTAAHKDKTGRNIEIFLANMGPLAQHKARADFSAGFMEVGGFTVLKNDGFADIASAAAAAIASKAQATVICSTDDTYPQIVPALTLAIKAQAPHMMVILAGMPAAEYKGSYMEAGLDECIHIKADCLAVLGKIQQAGGIE